MEIKIVEGNIAAIENLSVFNPKQVSIILHNVNCQGAMGSMIGNKLKDKYPNIEQPYIEYVNQVEKRQRKMLLGHVVPVPVANRVQVFHIFGQVFYGNEGRYINYDGFYTALEAVYEKLKNEDVRHFDIYMPADMGCDRSGGNPKIIETIISETIGKLDCNLYAVKFLPAHQRYEGSENFDYYKTNMQNGHHQNGNTGGYRGNQFNAAFNNRNHQREEAANRDWNRKKAQNHW